MCRRIGGVCLSTAALVAACCLCIAATAYAGASPVVLEESAFNVTSSAASLQAVVNPSGSATRIYFEYGLTASYGENAPSTVGEAAGSGEEETKTVPIRLKGLQPNSRYHYRVVAVGETGPGENVEVTGPDGTFRTRPGVATGPLGEPVPASLLDGRIQELVSPPDKRGALVEAIGQEGLIQAATDGAALTYHVDAPTESNPAGYANEVQVLSNRTPSGWGTRDIAIPHPAATGKSEGIGEDYRFFSEDLSQAIVQPAGGFTPLSPAASEQTPYLRVNFPEGESGTVCPTVAQETAGDSCYLPLVTGAPGYANVPPGTVFGQLGNQGGEVGPCPSNAAVCGPEFVGASADANHVLVSTSAVPVALTITPVPGGGLYEWSAGVLSLTSLLPENEGGAPAGHPSLGATNYDVRNAISSNGARVVWSGSDEGGERHLYLRDAGLNETIRLDVGLLGTPRFQIASKDDSTIFFTDEGTLYECRVGVVAGKLNCELSPVAEEMQGTVLGASEDGAWIYFVSNSVLASGATQGNCNQAVSEAGASCNLYARHEGTVKLVSAISGEDSPDWGKEAEPGDLHGLTARVSPNGMWLAFMSQRSLTGFNNDDAVTGRPDEEVFIYSAEQAQVRCASCNPTEERPEGEEYGFKAKLVGGSSVWSEESALAANVPGWTPIALGIARYQSRYLSNNGRLFFNSRDSLVSEDTNKQWDVYEYEPPGTGSCSVSDARYVESAAGCVDLISPGSSANESAFLDASAVGGQDAHGGEGGGDVFFLTTEKLVPEDFDGGADVYDAHECTATSPCPPSAAVEQSDCSTGESCRGPLPAPLVFSAPPSTIVPATGNVVPAPAVRGAPKRQTKNQRLLAAALKKCQKKRSKKARNACDRHARALYKVPARKTATAKRRTK
jgi:hypothetical protein